jgi:ankyrin repeat protein
MSMLVSSSHPAAAGVQLALALLLVDRGARLRGAGSTWESAVLTALTFGYLDTARGLAARAEPIDSVVELAGLGRLDELRVRIASAPVEDRQAALSVAAQLGHAEVVDLLVRHGADPARFNPEGFHSHSTPLHQAVWSGHRAVVERLVAAGAPLDVTDTLYDGTPLDWARYGKRDDLVTLLASRNRSS